MAAVEPGKPFRLGLHFKLAKGWHIYWKNPGAAGEPPQLDLDLPEGAKASDIAWPTPERVRQSDEVMSYAYLGEVLLPFTVTPTAGDEHPLRIGKSRKRARLSPPVIGARKRNSAMSRSPPPPLKRPIVRDLITLSVNVVLKLTNSDLLIADYAFDEIANADVPAPVCAGLRVAAETIPKMRRWFSPLSSPARPKRFELLTPRRRGVPPRGERRRTRAQSWAAAHKWVSSMTRVSGALPRSLTQALEGQEAAQDYRLVGLRMAHELDLDAFAHRPPAVATGEFGRRGERVKSTLSRYPAISLRPYRFR